MYPSAITLHHLQRLLDALDGECRQHGRLARAFLIVCLQEAVLGHHHECAVQAALGEHMNGVLRPRQRGRGSLRVALPTEDGFVEFLRARSIGNGDFQPADLPSR